MRNALRIVVGVLGCVALVTLVQAAPAGEDCPLARENYSSQTVLLDLLIDPAAHTILERVAPSVLKPSWLRAGTWSTEPPTFAAIVTPASLLKADPDAPAKIAALDAELARVPLTTSATRARCARYDSSPPKLSSSTAHPAILVFDKVTGFRDNASIDAAAAALREMGKRRGWNMQFTDNGAVFNPKDLARFDVVVWNNVSGDVLTLPQRDAFQTYITRGGGFAGMHGSGGDPIYIWDWYVDELIGARFIGHPANPQFQAASVRVDDRTSPVVQGLGDGWTMTEEWYSFAASPRLRGAHILATLDESTYTPVANGRDLRMGDHPIAWTQCIGHGRSFYSAIGHRPENYSEPHSVALLEQGIAWAAGLTGPACK